MFFPLKPSQCFILLPFACGDVFPLISSVFYNSSLKAVCLYFFSQVGAGKGYKLTIGEFLSLYSTLGDALSPDPCGAPRAANQDFSAKWAEKLSIIVSNPEIWTKMRVIRRIVQTKPFSPRLLVRIGSVEDGGTQVILANIPTSGDVICCSGSSICNIPFVFVSN